MCDSLEYKKGEHLKKEDCKRKKENRDNFDDNENELFQKCKKNLEK